MFAGIVPGSITLPANVVDSCRQLLALAVAGVEHWQLQQVPPTQALNGDPSDPAPAAASGAEPTYSRVLTSVDSSSVPEAAAMLTAAQETARALLKGLRLDEAMEARMRRVRGWARTAMMFALYSQQLVCCLPIAVCQHHVPDVATAAGVLGCCSQAELCSCPFNLMSHAAAALTPLAHAASPTQLLCLRRRAV